MGAKKRNEIHWTINPANDNDALYLRFTEMDNVIKIGVGIDNGKSQIGLEMGLSEFEAFIRDLEEFKELVNQQIIFKTQITKFSQQNTLGSAPSPEKNQNAPINTPDKGSLPQPAPLPIPTITPNSIPTIKPQTIPVIPPQKVAPINPTPTPISNNPPQPPEKLPIEEIGEKDKANPENFNMEENLKNMEAMDNALNTLTENFGDSALDQVKPPELKMEAPKVTIPQVTPPESKASLSKKDDKSKLKESDWDPW